MPRGTPPQAALENIEPSKVQKVVSSLRELHEMGKPQTDEETEERIMLYARYCEQSLIRPGIEALCYSLHITRTTLHRWAAGENCSARKQDAIQSAMQFVTAFIEQAGLNGAINPVSFIFLMKNWGCGYSDQYSINQGMQETKHIITSDELPLLDIQNKKKIDSLPVLNTSKQNTTE